MHWFFQGNIGHSPGDQGEINSLWFIDLCRGPDANPETSGGPVSTTPVNEQDRILSKYLQSWEFTSAHLHLNDTPSSYTFENTSKLCKSTIDHFLCVSHNLALFNYCHVLHDLPSNTSDHCPLVAQIRSNVFCCSQQQKNNTFSEDLREYFTRVFAWHYRCWANIYSSIANELPGEVTRWIQLTWFRPQITPWDLLGRAVGGRAAIDIRNESFL